MLLPLTLLSLFLIVKLRTKAPQTKGEILTSKLVTGYIYGNIIILKRKAQFLEEIASHYSFVT